MGNLQSAQTLSAALSVTVVLDTEEMDTTAQVNSTLTCACLWMPMYGVHRY